MVPFARRRLALALGHGYRLARTQKFCNAVGLLFHNGRNAHGYEFELALEQCLNPVAERTPVAFVDAEVGTEIEQGLLPDLAPYAFAVAEPKGIVACSVVGGMG